MCSQHSKGRFTYSMPCPWRAYAFPLPCRAAKGLECVFPIWFTKCGRVWFTLAMPGPCRAHPMLSTCRSSQRPRHSTAVERRPVGYLPAFGFFRLPRGVPRRLLSEAYQSSSQRSIPTTVKSGSSALQKRRSVKLSEHCRGAPWHGWETACKRHGHGMLCVNRRLQDVT